MSNPMVSVYLPTRNRSTLVFEAARSVLDQTYRDLELVIADDASDDDTPSVLDNLAKSDSRVKVIRSSIRVGPSAIRNLAVDASKGELITGIDDDDLMLPLRVETLVRASNIHKSLICTGFFVERNERRRIMNARPRAITLSDLFHYNVVGNQSIFRRSHFIEVAGFDESLPASEDYDLWTRIVDRFGPGSRITPATYIKREIVGSGQLTGSSVFSEGAFRYTEKHRHRMSRSQLRSQRLIQMISQNKKIGFTEIAATLSAPTSPILARYLASRLFTKSNSRHSRR